MIRVIDVIKDVPEKKSEEQSPEVYNDLGDYFSALGYNQALEELLNSEVDVEIDREKFAKSLAADDETWIIDEKFREYWLDRTEELIQNKSSWMKGKS